MNKVKIPRAKCIEFEDAVTGICRLKACNMLEIQYIAGQ